MRLYNLIRQKSLYNLKRGSDRSGCWYKSKWKSEHVHPPTSTPRNFPRNEQYILNMYFYKVWTWDFIEHVRIPHSILSHFLDRGFLGWRAQNWASIVPCPTNNTQSSAIYKLTIRLVDYLNFKELHLLHRFADKNTKKLAFLN